MENITSDKQTNNLPVIKYISYALVFLTPFFFLPTTLNFFATNKQAFVIVSAIALLIATGVSHITKKSHSHNSSPLLFPLGLFAASIIINLVINTEARTESLINRGSLFIALTLIAYFISTVKNVKGYTKSILNVLVGTSSLLAFHGILQLLFLHNLTVLPVWMQSRLFTLTGSPLTLLTIIVPGLAATIAWAIKTNNTTRKSVLLVLTGIQLAAIVAYGSLMMPGKELAIQLLPIRAGWSITLDALKTGRNLLFGIGLNNFSSFYTQAKPLFVNQTDLWSITAGTSSMEVLQLITTTGLVGFVTFMIMVGAAFRLIRSLPKTAANTGLSVAIYAILASFLIVPANITNYTLLFVLFGVIAAAGRESEHKRVPLPGNFGLVAGIVVLALAAVSGYFGWRVYAAETNMRKAQLAINENNAQAVYDHHLRAVQLVPSMASYHASFSQINLSLASSISQTENLSDQQREQVTVLVQRAIESGRIATQLRPSLFSNWQNLAVIYRNLINVAEGAEQFAVDYYSQAINLNPASPTLRVELGGLYYQLAQVSEDENTQIALLNQAIQQFQTAVQLRPSYANGYYNLAKALEAGGNITGAYQAMQQVVGNLDPTTQDYQTALAELNSLEERLPQEEVQQPPTEGESTGELTEPEPLPSPIPGGPIELPEDEELPTPSPSAESSPTPTATPAPSPAL